ELHCERNDLPTAMQYLLRGQELGEHNGLPQHRYRWQVAMARIRKAEGDLGDALDLLGEAERVYVSDFFPNVRPVPALRARVQVQQGAVDEALTWARERGLSVDDELSYLREFEHITLARVLLAQHAEDRAERSLHEATRLLERLLPAAEEGARTGRVIEILVLQALAHQVRGDVPAALASVKRALTLSEPEGYVRVFVDEGLPMASLLRAVARGRTWRTKGNRPELHPPTPGSSQQDRGQHARQTAPG
ncbi:MAG: helix-turn-helix transcriptional regulator, partial [Actinomycetota bacterium]